ncbi:MAG: tRNA 2-thiouridine(34) synthase MnmA [Actinobacteria bacterium]|nr:tRNA 2-thiouridine(34) synthase MnmA [Actinomycetota bacterium]
MRERSEGRNLNNMVAVAMSGGVDSSVSAALLHNQGYRVVGIGLQLVDETEANGSARNCCGIGEMEDARRVAEKLGIPFYVLNFKDVFRKHVIDYFTASYLKGETPNPCVPCNGVVKFDTLLKAAMGFGAGLLATGHYAGVEFDVVNNRYVLKKGADGSKDQSYFLYSLSQEQLARAIFPMSDIQKVETRAIARGLRLKVHDKPESQDICFVGTEGYASYISRHAGVLFEPGPILDDAGVVLGTHQGLYRYTIGQRRGLNLSSPKPVYVIDIDPVHNSVTVAPGDRTRRQQRVLLGRMNYVSISKPREPLEVEAVTRYRKPHVPATLAPVDEDSSFALFHYPQEPTAPGQSVVLYHGDTVLCGGIVRRNNIA